MSGRDRRVLSHCNFILFWGGGVKFDVDCGNGRVFGYGASCVFVWLCLICHTCFYVE